MLIVSANILLKNASLIFWRMLNVSSSQIIVSSNSWKYWTWLLGNVRFDLKFISQLQSGLWSEIMMNWAERMKCLLTNKEQEWNKILYQDTDNTWHLNSSSFDLNYQLSSGLNETVQNIGEHNSKHSSGYRSVTGNDLTLGYQTSNSASSSKFHHLTLLVS